MTQKIVTLAGGTGSLQVLTGLRKYPDVEVATVMTMVDDGGSTGRMRETFDDMPAFGGDFRDALVGLAENEELAEVFMHRFEKGGELRGHSIGNIILLGLFEASGGNIPKALDIVHKILKVRGRIYPSTTESIGLGCEYDDGTVLTSEYEINNTPKMGGHRVTKCFLHPGNPKAFSKAVKILKEADKIVMGPGDIYSNIIANILVDGIAEAINESKAEKIYVTNLMTRYNQTHGFKATDFASEIEKYLGGKLDYVIVNNAPLSDEINNKYSDEKWFMVEDDISGEEGYKVIRDKVWMEGKEYKRVSSDVVPRSFIRHDPEKIAELIVKI